MFLIVQFGSKKTPFIKSCVEACGQQAEIVEWKDVNEKPGNLTGMIWSGSPTYLTEVDHSPYHSKISPLLEWGVPILGICFGHQLLGVLHGAQIYRGQPVVRDQQIKLLQDDELYEGLGKEFIMHEDHTEGINVPENFIHLATSDTFPNEGMKHKEKNFRGVQFHPEVSGEHGMVIFRNFVKLCNPKS
jgi:GMP synthase (glutamine-hydrolysing)